MRSLFGKAVLLPALVLVCALGIAGAISATVSTFTGPAGTNPAVQPQNLSDYNTIINGINNNAAFAGNGAPSSSFAMQATTSTGLGSGLKSQVALQVINSALYTTATGASTCNATGASWCLGIFDASGTLRWLSGN